MIWCHLPIRRFFNRQRLKDNPMRLTHAVLEVLAKNLSLGELEKLRATVSPHLRQIWIESEQAVDLSDYV